MKIEIGDGLHDGAVFEITEPMDVPPARIEVSADGQTITADGKVIGKRCAR